MLDLTDSSGRCWESIVLRHPEARASDPPVAWHLRADCGAELLAWLTIEVDQVGSLLPQAFGPSPFRARPIREPSAVADPSGVTRTVRVSGRDKLVSVGSPDKPGGLAAERMVLVRSCGRHR
jgi:hypothetical protein